MRPGRYSWSLIAAVNEETLNASSSKMAISAMGVLSRNEKSRTRRDG
jgi:hypothetical protein